MRVVSQVKVHVPRHLICSIKSPNQVVKWLKAFWNPSTYDGIRASQSRDTCFGSPCRLSSEKHDAPACIWEDCPHILSGALQIRWKEGLVRAKWVIISDGRGELHPAYDGGGPRLGFHSAPVILLLGRHGVQHVQSGGELAQVLSASSGQR